MKRYSINILNALAGLLLMMSCANEEIIEKDRGGEAATVSLSLEVPDVEKIQTKALNDYTLVNNLYLFIFDTNGNLEHSQEYNPGKSTTISGIEITSGDHYIYAVANTDNSYAPIPGLNNVRSKQDLLDIRAQLNEKHILALSGNDVPMFGILENADGSGLINISKGPSSHKIQLKRLLSSVTFTVQCKGKDAAFDLKSFEVVNIPTTATLLEKNVLGSDNKIKWSGSITNSTDKQSFNFALLENVPFATAGTITSYDDREKKIDPKAVGDAVEFALAPAGATYVVLKGIYKGPSGSMGNVSADVTYYVHLGNTNQDQGGSNDNFENRRNIDYTYNVYVESVDKLITEVSSEDPYDRGDGTVSTVDQIFDVDAHYETFNITIPRPGVNEEFNYQLDEGQSFPDWVSFRIFDKVDDNHTWALAPGKEAQWEKVMKYKHNTSTTEGYNEQLITSIEDLNTKLKAYFENHPDDDAVITCFVAENPDDNYRESSIFRTKISGNGSNVLTNGFRIRQNYGRKFFNNGGGFMLEVLNETGKLNEYGSRGKCTNYLDNGLATMKIELGNVSAEVSNVSWPSKDEMMKIYAACMARNRDEDGDGKISDKEVKWYLPAINQYIGMWMGAGALKEASLYTLDYLNHDVHYISNSYKNATDQLMSGDAKYILWSEEGSSTGPIANLNSIVQEIGGQKYYGIQFRCIRNFGDSSEPKYYVHDLKNKTITTYLNEGAYRAKQTSGEVGQEGGHMGESNKLYPIFKYSDVKGGYLQPGYVIGNADKDNSLCSNYHEGIMKEGVVYKPTKCDWWGNLSEDNYFLYVGNKKGNYALEKCGSKFHESEIMKESKNGNYVLISEKEAFEDGGKWRLPNQRELVMMNVVGLLPEGDKYFMSRTVSKFEPNRTFIYHGKLENLSLMYVNAANDWKQFYVRCVRDY